MGARTFADATAVAPDGPGRWRASVPPAWNVPTGVHGGMLVAVALRAALAERDAAGHTEQALRTAHASFLARPGDGELAMATEVVRTGGTTTHVDVTTRHPDGDRDLLATRVLFTRPRPDGGGDFTDAVPPEVPGPDDCSPDRVWGSSGGPLRVPPLFDQFDMRPAFGVLPWEPTWEPGLPARYGRWNRLHDPVLTDEGHHDPLALLPMADLPGPSLWTRFGPDEPLRALTSLELTVHVLEPVRDPWVLTDFRTRWLGEGYAHTTCDLWSGGRLVAVSEQMMLVRPMVVVP